MRAPTSHGEHHAPEDIRLASAIIQCARSLRQLVNDYEAVTIGRTDDFDPLRNPSHTWPKPPQAGKPDALSPRPARGSSSRIDAILRHREQELHVIANIGSRRSEVTSAVADDVNLTANTSPRDGTKTLSLLEQFVE